MNTLFWLSLYCTFIVINGCGKPCNDGSTSCCIREGCGCVETSGTTAGCSASCNADDGLCCPQECDDDSIACCIISEECGCSDIETFIKNGGSDSQCIRTCSSGDTCYGEGSSYNEDDVAVPLQGVKHHANHHINHHVDDKTVDAVVPLPDSHGLDTNTNSNGNGHTGLFWFLIISMIISVAAILYFKCPKFRGKWGYSMPLSESSTITNYT
eukprot:552518_1